MVVVLFSAIFQLYSDWKYCGWLYFYGYQFSWGSKFMSIVISFITRTENRFFVGTGIRGLDSLRKS